MRDEMMAAAHESSPSSGHCLTMNNDFSEGDVGCWMLAALPRVTAGVETVCNHRPGEGARPMGNAVMEGGVGGVGGNNKIRVLIRVTASTL